MSARLLRNSRLIVSRNALINIPRVTTPILRRSYASPSISTRGESPWAKAAIYSLGAVGVGCLAYAGFDAYDSWRNMFPEEVRLPLKRGIAAKNAGDSEGSIAHKREAWAIARTLPISSFQPPDPYFKLTGIAIDLAGELEETGDISGAYTLYSEALDKLREADGLNTQERMRGVGIALKLGWLVEQSQSEEGGKLVVSKEEEERVRVWPVQEVLKISLEAQRQSTGKEAESVDFATLQLPEGMSKTDICVPLVKLGEFYSKHGKPQYAMPLYLQAATLLVANGGASVPRNDLCNGARMMNTIAQLVITAQPTQEGLTAAETWTARSLNILKLAQDQAKGSPTDGTCETALAVTLINAGMLREMAGDGKQAHDFLSAAMKQAKAIGLEDGVAEIQKAIDRVAQKQKV
ncbi:hypothetical protein MIND_00138900 [Mycena indigotica]|uniref:Uncharacterized protein n=1 Tax=Mycena indigotica TaxID=2126181 RepID=A0A8H6TCC3_9AGAR|nr:uncharacterized protein MIND_00138900 [Mycena indigotica]KAF7316205.1 hypothetical protein MIND_00138900 [Mycena indigotica]